MKNLLKSIVLGLSLIVTILVVPSAHRLWLRSKVESQVVRITTEAGNSGGTGVHVKLPSGKVAILTNSHVCSHVKDDQGIVWVSEDGERPVPKRVIEESNFTDLCLVQPLEHHSGLSLASNIYSGETVHAIGHPLLMPITMTSGEIIFEGEIQVFDHMGSDNCTKPKNKIVDSMFGPACVVDITADYMTVNILPGNSGSPVVNGFGNIVGLVFAGDSDIHWGVMIKLADINEFLKLY
jgi:S1-C subfamily serine protease